MQSPQCKPLTTAALGLPLSWLPGMEVSSLALRTWDPDKAETLLGLLCCQPAQAHLSPAASLCCQSHQQPQGQGQCPSQGTRTMLRRRNFSLERRRLRSNFIGVFTGGRC